MSVLTWRVLDKHSYLDRHFRLPPPPQTVSWTTGNMGGDVDQMRRWGGHSLQRPCRTTPSLILRCAETFLNSSSLGCLEPLNWMVRFLLAHRVSGLQLLGSVQAVLHGSGPVHSNFQLPVWSEIHLSPTFCTLERPANLTGSLMLLPPLPHRRPAAEWWRWRWQQTGGGHQRPPAWHRLGPLPRNRPIRRQHRWPGSRGKISWADPVLRIWLDQLKLFFFFFKLMRSFQPSTSSGSWGDDQVHYGRYFWSIISVTAFLYFPHMDWATWRFCLVSPDAKK